MAREPAELPTLGAELRRLRIAAGLTLDGLAELTGFSKGYISRVETSKRTSPGPQFVRSADAVLDAGGRLIALANEQADVRATPRPTEALHGNVSPRPPEAPPVNKTDAMHTLEAFQLILRQLRDLGQTLNPTTVVEMAKPHISALQDLAAHLDGKPKVEALRLASHFTEFASWMTQETGDDITALRWIDMSATLASEIDDTDLVANSYLRRANIALYQQAGHGTIAYAQQAQALDCSPRLMFLAVLREAQGHALEGDYQKFRECIERAVTLRSQADAEQQEDRPAERSERRLVAPKDIGSTKIPDLRALAEGWSLYDLGRSTEAIHMLEPLLASTERKDNRAWARIACRLALALASAREVERACGLAREILSLTTVARSATIRSDLRLLSRTLSRWNTDPNVREIMPLLSAALVPTVDGRPSSRPAPEEMNR